ncbi:tyrosine-type recombinase/integrase [Flavobacterium sp. 25HG05S-40]|uniref:tyrosine-type recombinase/integrase n=1 Tax=Flavobacterium sp. 25HG05S-40 TaxID=3458682 RepID=UPI0040448A9A
MKTTKTTRKKATRVFLPNGCSYSLSVYPPDWKSCTIASLEFDWRIQYYFYDPNFPKPKTPKVVKGMNECKDLTSRREVTQALIDDEIKAFEDGYNPYLKKYVYPEPEEPVNELHRNLKFIDAFRGASAKLKGLSKEYLGEIDYAINRIEKAAKKLNKMDVKIYDLKRSELKALLEYMDLPDDYFNKFKAYFAALYKELIEWECCETNITRDIQKRVVVRKQREVYTREQIDLILEALRPDYYEFYRYSKIFFFSGSRSRELFTVQAKNVRLDMQEYDILIKKGKQYVWETKVIFKSAIPFWTEIMSLVKSQEDYIFSVGLIPGPVQINSKQITIRWRTHVKHKLSWLDGNVRKISELLEFGIRNFQKITADFYSLKYTFLDLLDELDSDNLGYAQIMAAHRKDSTTQIYAHGRSKRKNERMKKIKV